MSIPPKRCLLLFLLSFQLSFSKTTVISHGYNFPGYDPLGHWMLEMAEAICDRQGGGSIYQYDSQTGECEKLKSLGDKQNNSVILFDWKEDSNDPEPGHSEAAGNALFCALVEGKETKGFDLEKLHLIGHSRGCVVNSEAAERLLTLGYPVDQMTFLDAHDWGLNVTHVDTYVNPVEMESGVEAWKGVQWADAYWHAASIGLSGRPVNGAYSQQLDVKRHFEVYRWYLDSIQDRDSKEGYYWSESGGGASDRPPISGNPVEAQFSFLSDGLVNGSFDLEPPLSRRIAGWAHHGGGGFGHIDNGILELDLGNHSKSHDRVFIHDSVQFLTFDLMRSNADPGQADKGDQFVVSINDEKVLQIPLNLTDKHFEKQRIPLAPFIGKVVMVSFKILDEKGGKRFINSEVKIDNVHFE